MQQKKPANSLLGPNLCRTNALAYFIKLPMAFVRKVKHWHSCSVWTMANPLGNAAHWWPVLQVLSSFLALPLKLGKTPSHLLEATS